MTLKNILKENGWHWLIIIIPLYITAMLEIGIIIDVIITKFNIRINLALQLLVSILIGHSLSYFVIKRIFSFK